MPDAAVMGSEPVAFFALVALVLWLPGIWLLWHIRFCLERRESPGPDAAESGTPGQPPATVSVIIPARNEESRLPSLLKSLAFQTRPADEVIVVDDHSTDGTAALAAAAGARVVTARSLPPDWNGKTWACWSGAEAATGRILVFLDADTTLATNGLANLIEEHRRDGGLLTVQPFHVTIRPYERLSVFPNITLMMSMNVFTPLGRRMRSDGAFGPCMVCSREDYFETGGHRAVRGAILEDFFLGRLFCHAGKPVNCLAGRGTISFRMYPEGFWQMVEGWSKTFGSGSTGTSKSTLAFITAWMVGCGLTTLLTAAAPFVGASGGALIAGAYLLYAGQIHWMLRRIGHFGWWPAALFPVPLVFFVLIFLRAMILMFVLKRVRWKGRDISTCPYRDAKLG